MVKRSDVNFRKELFGYLYGVVYPALSKSLNEDVSVLDLRYKEQFGVIEKKYMSTRDLREYIDAVKAVGIINGCDIESMKGKLNG